MSWDKSSYTDAGAALLSESISGGALTITRAVSGTGTVDTDLSKENVVGGDTHELTILKTDVVKKDGQTCRRVYIWTNGADSTYIMHQIGVYGRLNDGAETLLFLMQDDRGFEIPAVGTKDGYEFQITVLLAVSSNANISITVDPQVQAIMRMVQEAVQAQIESHNTDPAAHAQVITEVTSKALKELEESGEIMSEERVKELIRESGGGGGSGGGYYGRYDLTLTADGWQPTPEGGEKPYQYIYDAELSDSTTELVPVGTASIDSFSVASKAGVLPICETFDGYVRFYAQRMPGTDIKATVILLGKGGGSSGEVRTGPGLMLNTEGEITVRVGSGLTIDSNKALSVENETVMTSEDLLDEEETQQEIVDMLK